MKKYAAIGFLTVVTLVVLLMSALSASAVRSYESTGDETISLTWS